MSRLGLFDGYGVELEYMIVDRQSLSVRPLAARLLVDEEGEVQSEVDHGPISWSNELVSHVLELKTTEPARSLEGLDELFAASIRAANLRLDPVGCALLGTGAHPFFDPGEETVIWPGEYTEVYRAYDRIFGVRGHGWSNLQSAHLNLPFADDGEFGRLHAAVRLVLPLIPALAASTPYLDGVRMPQLDARLHVYRHNQDRIPAMVGRVVPEAVFTEAEYEERIFAPVLAALAEHDPGGVLNKYFANSRGAIARFDRGSIEIRVVDLQECPTADVGVLALVVAVIRAMVEERWAPQARQRSWDEGRLAGIFEGCVRQADEYVVADRAYAQLFGADATVTAGELWEHCYRSVGDTIPGGYARAIELILDRGTLARRLVTALGAAPGRGDFREVYARLAGCLAENRLFDPVG